MSIERTNMLRELIKSKTFLHLPSVYDPVSYTHLTLPTS